MSPQQVIKEKVEQWSSYFFDANRSVGMFFCVSQDLYATLSSHYSLSQEDSLTPDGLILNPSQAGQCLPEIQRTTAFVNGLDEAVRLKKSKGSTPCLLYTSPSPRDRQKSRMPSSA